MNSAVQGNILRDHLLQLIYNGLDSVTCCYSILLIACDANLVLNTTKNVAKHKIFTFHVFLKLNYMILRLTNRIRFHNMHFKVNKHYLVLIIFLRELDVDVMVSTDLGDYSTLATNYLGVIFGIHSDGQFEAPESLLKKMSSTKKKQLQGIKTSHCTYFSS